jgi:hypothetical protein
MAAIPGAHNHLLRLLSLQGRVETSLRKTPKRKALIMGKIQTNAQRHARYEIIAKAEGEQCLPCKIEKGRRVGPPKNRLVIEHADNNQKNWDFGNLHFSCYSHNKKMEKLTVHDKILQLRAYSDQLEKERQRENLPTWKDVLKDLVGYENGSIEMQATKIFLPKWMKFVHDQLEQYKSLNRKYITLAAAQKVGCSKQTSINYMEVQTAPPDGPFKEQTDGEGNKIIVFRYEVKGSL